MWDCYSNVENNVENYAGTTYSFLGFGLNNMRPLDSGHDTNKGPVIIINHLKSIYKSQFIPYSHLFSDNCQKYFLKFFKGVFVGPPIPLFELLVMCSALGFINQAEFPWSGASFPEFNGLLGCPYERDTVQPLETFSIIFYSLVVNYCPEWSQFLASNTF